LPSCRSFPASWVTGTTARRRRDHQVRVEAADRVPASPHPQGQLDRHVVPAVGEFGMYPLRHAVVGAGNKQDPHQRPPPRPFLAGACQAGVDAWLGVITWRPVTLDRRKKLARLAGVGDVQMVPRPGARHEQDATLLLQILGMRKCIFARGGHR
jgi:hypothetical protein